MRPARPFGSAPNPAPGHSTAPPVNAAGHRKRRHVEELAVRVRLSSLPAPAIPLRITAVGPAALVRGARRVTDTRAALPSTEDVLVLQNDAVSPYNQLDG
ncbi:hypothetical protein GCM10022207_92950 [Streptomyces lannensis]|uniref:Uncharacterized protein n=1 Tax=Streptomyces lannensis TaxID=766498 RepID=A0ABP7LWC7_9ACTN